MPTAKVLEITKQTGVAGQVQFTVKVTYPEHDDHVYTSRLVGSVYGSPGSVTLISDDGWQGFVDDTTQYGTKFNEHWVRAFYTK